MYITKYSLNNGIEEAKIIEKCNMTDDYTKKSRLLYLCEYDSGKRFYCEPDHVFNDLESAKNKAEKMREEEIENLSSEIERLRSISF